MIYFFIFAGVSFQINYLIVNLVSLEQEQVCLCMNTMFEMIYKQK